MEITVLGATGGTGRHLVAQALQRGHTVRAVARDPSRVAAGLAQRVADGAGATRRATGDVRPASVAGDTSLTHRVVGGPGPESVAGDASPTRRVAGDAGPASVAGGAGLTAVAADVLDPVALARALDGATVIVSGLGIASGEAPGVLAAGARAAAASGARVIWLAALGTGPSAAAAGALTRTLLRTFMRKELPDRVAATETVLAAGGTVFHAGPLTDGPLSVVRRTLALPDVPRRLFPAGVSRATVAAAMLDEAEAAGHPGEAVAVIGGR